MTSLLSLKRQGRFPIGANSSRGLDVLEENRKEKLCLQISDKYSCMAVNSSSRVSRGVDKETARVSDGKIGNRLTFVVYRNKAEAKLGCPSQSFY